MAHWLSKFRFTIRYKLIFAFALVLLVPSLTIGFSSYQEAKQNLAGEVTASAKQNVGMLNDLITSTVEPEMSSVEYLSQLLPDSLFQGDVEQVRDRLDKFTQLHPELLYAYVGTKNGQMIIEPPTELPADFDPRTRPWYVEAMKKPGNTIITEPYVDVGSGTITVTIARTTLDASGVISVDLNLNHLTVMTNRVQIGNEGFVSLLDQTGKVLVHPTAEVGKPAQGEWAAKLTQEGEGSFQFAEGGAAKQMVFVTNDLTGWKVAGTLNLAEFDEAAAPILNRTYLILGIAVVVGALFIYLMVRAIARPLRLLSASAYRISHGDLTERITVRTNDEVGDLAVAFNDMSDSLRTVLREVGETAGVLASAAEEMTASAEHTAKATEHIAVTVQHVAEGVEAQVVSVEQSSQAIHEMSAGIQQVADNAQGVSVTAMKTSDLAAEGNRALETVSHQMDSIFRTVNTLAESVKNLGERSHRIGEIVTVITAIAEQTNLLALNAAIEASRAGEQGRGFAVVADEVRKLAEQSSASAAEITQVVETIRGNTHRATSSMEAGVAVVQEGLDVVHDAGESFAQIQAYIQLVSQQIAEVSAAAQQLSAGGEQVRASVNHIAEVAVNSASGTQTVSAAAEEQLASMEQISASAASLNRVSEELTQLLRRFKV